MADKTKTIKGATDKEIDDLITRLRKENELQNLVGEIKRKSLPLPNDYSQYGSVPPISIDAISTEAPIESLYHIGVLGMKWGRRSASGSSGATSSKSKKSAKDDVSEDFTNAKGLKAKGYKNLSTKELKDLTQRMQLEKQLRDLKTSDYTKGLDIVKGITAAGTTIAGLYALSNTPLGQAIKTAVKTATSRQLKIPGF